MDIFTAIYFVALVIETAIRAPLNKMRRQEKMSERRITNQEKILLGLLLLGGVVAPIIYAATDWLDFADYTLPAWAGWLGVLLIASAVFVFWRAHADLAGNEEIQPAFGGGTAIQTEVEDGEEHFFETK